ncbi:MAG: hypothetical protein QM758_01465 [Armatimonas sp.]
MFKKTLLIGFLLLALVGVVGAIAFRPLEKYQYSQLEGGFRQETYKRYWKILPFSQWSVHFTESIPEGGREAYGKYIRRFGFVSLTEDRWTLAVHLPEPEQQASKVKP